MTNLNSLMIAYSRGCREPRGRAFKIVRMRECRTGVRLVMTKGASMRNATNRCGVRWSSADYTILVSGLADGSTLEDIAVALKRTVLSVICRLCLLGIVVQNQVGGFFWASRVHSKMLQVEPKSQSVFCNRLDVARKLRLAGWGRVGNWILVPVDKAGESLHYWYDTPITMRKL